MLLAIGPVYVMHVYMYPRYLDFTWVRQRMSWHRNGTPSWTFLAIQKAQFLPKSGPSPLHHTSHALLTGIALPAVYITVLEFRVLMPWRACFSVWSMPCEGCLSSLGDPIEVMGGLWWNSQLWVLLLPDHHAVWGGWCGPVLPDCQVVSVQNEGGQNQNYAEECVAIFQACGHRLIIWSTEHLEYHRLALRKLVET